MDPGSGKELPASTMQARLNRSARPNSRLAILSLLRQYGPCSRKEIAERTGLSQPSVSALVKELLREGLVREVGPGESSGGRRPVLLDLNAAAYYVLGAMVESDRIDFAVADLSGRAVSTHAVAVNLPGGADAPAGEAALARLAEAVKEVMSRSGLEPDRLLGIGVGVPGIVQPETGRVRRAPGVGWWQDVAVRAGLEERLGVPVVVENDVNLMALGEYARGAGRGARCLVLVYVGTGIGAGIVVEGRLFRGAASAAGEIGYLPLGPAADAAEGRPGFGVFEQQFSARAVARFLAEQGWARGRRPVAALVEAARHRPELRPYLEQVIRHWAYGVASLVAVLDPDRVLLAGDAADIGAEGLEQIREVLARLLPEVPAVGFAALGDQAGLVGAVHRVLSDEAGLTGALPRSARARRWPAS